MPLSDIFKDRNRYSAHKIWFNIGNIAYTIAFLHDSWKYELTSDKSFAYGAIVIGSGIAFKWLNNKNGLSNPALEEHTTKS